MKDFLKLIFFGVTKSPKLWLINPETGEKKGIPFGFDLQVLLLGSFFGLPLFPKRLWGWAWGLFLLSSLQFYFFYLRVQQILAATSLAEYEAVLEKADTPVEKGIGMLLIVCVALLSVKGNQWAVERLLKKGWHFESLKEPLVKKAAKKWNLPKEYLKEETEKF